VKRNFLLAVALAVLAAPALWAKIDRVDLRVEGMT
jgi:hypothetical protein